MRAIAVALVVVGACVAAVSVWPRGGGPSVRFGAPTVAVMPFDRFAGSDVTAFASATPGGSLIERQQLAVLSPGLPVVLPNGVTPAAFGGVAAGIAPARLRVCDEPLSGVCPAAAYLLAAAATDADGNLLSRGVAAARVMSLVREMRADALGLRVRETVSLRGGGGVVMRWTMVDSVSGQPVFDAWLSENAAYRATSGRPLSFWVPLPRRAGPVMLRFDAYRPPDAASIGSLCLQSLGASQKGFATTSCTSRIRRSRNPASE